MVQPSQEAPTAKLEVKATRGLSGAAVAKLLQDLRTLVDACVEVELYGIAGSLEAMVDKLETGGYDGTSS